LDNFFGGLLTERAPEKPSSREESFSAKRLCGEPSPPTSLFFAMFLEFRSVDLRGQNSGVYYKDHSIMDVALIFWQHPDCS
jgi:hypothetical protein